MLLHENYTAEHISRLREETGADPSILERTVFAFGLLEAIRSVDMPFIFKVGTSLLVTQDNELWPLGVGGVRQFSAINSY